MTLHFTIPGSPKGKGRPRFHRIGNFVSTYSSKETVLYENLVRSCFIEAYPNTFFDKDTPLSMTVIAFMDIPTSISKKKRQQMLDWIIRPIKKPDSSNILKAIEDGLNTVAYNDDTQIVTHHVYRFYSANPRVEVYISDDLNYEIIPEA